uniref:Uncharacterized protein n=1 Tax=Romanomermis culicivorax TaxID=13658 RepID=A0A915KRR6_ROMCU
MEQDLKESMAIYNAKIREMEIKYRLLKEEDATPVMEKKAMEPPSPMKVYDDITIDKLVIDESVVEMLDLEMAESKEIFKENFDGGSVGKVAKTSQQNMQLLHPNTTSPGRTIDCNLAAEEMQLYTLTTTAPAAAVSRLAIKEGGRHGACFGMTKAHPLRQIPQQ